MMTLFLLHYIDIMECSKLHTFLSFKKFCLLLGLFFFCLVALSNTDVIFFAFCYYILFCHVWLLSLKNLFFYSERKKENESWGEGRWRDTGRNRGRRNCNQDVLYEKTIYFQKWENKLKDNCTENFLNNSKVLNILFINSKGRYN